MVSQMRENQGGFGVTDEGDLVSQMRGLPSTGAAPMEADRAKGGKNGGKGFQKRKPGQAKGRHQDLWRQEHGQR